MTPEKLFKVKSEMVAAYREYRQLRPHHENRLFGRKKSAQKLEVLKARYEEAREAYTDAFYRMLEDCGIDPGGMVETQSVVRREHIVKVVIDGSVRELQVTDLDDCVMLFIEGDLIEPKASRSSR